MGSGMATVFAAAGHPVILAGRDLARAEAAVAAIKARPLTTATAGEPDLRAGELADLADTHLVVESIVEDAEAKKQLYAQVEQVVGTDVILATNTSALPINDLAAGLAHPERFIGTHWFNPAELLPGVEVVPNTRTSPGVVTEVMAILRGIGKVPVRVGDSPGFVAARIQMALFTECCRIIAEGVTDAAGLDALVTSTFGMRLPFMGPMTVADLSGLDVYRASLRTMQRAFGDRFAVPAALDELVEGGALGAKAGHGFFEWSSQRHDDVVARREQQFRAVRDLQ